MTFDEIHNHCFLKNKSDKLNNQFSSNKFNPAHKFLRERTLPLYPIYLAMSDALKLTTSLNWHILSRPSIPL